MSREIDDLAAELAEFGGDLYVRRYVRSMAERRAADMIANTTPCTDFADFAPIFSAPYRSSMVRGGDRSIKAGDMFIVGGLLAYVAAIGDGITPRLRLIFSSGTESNMLAASLVRAFYRDRTARRAVRL